MELKVLVDASKKESEKENHSIYVDDPNIDLECCAYLYPKVYEKIFRKKKNHSAVFAAKRFSLKKSMRNKLVMHFCIC